MVLLKTSSIERIIKSIIPHNFKIFFYWVLANSLLGYFLKCLKIKKNLFGGVFDLSNVSNKEAASIFLGFWESAEIRFSKRFANSKTIIELGSSVGVTLGVLANNRIDTKFICIEASLKNYEKLIKLKKILPQKGNEYILLNKAVAYDVSHIHFEHTSTEGSKITKDNMRSSKSEIVLAITLSEILNQNAFKGPYTLITDIEGAESHIFFKDKIALKNCEKIIAELENTSMHTVDEQISELDKMGFKILEQYGNVFVMTKY
mgnify:FL=1|tara:strand:+ start:137 stop:919 length:783 start_codon:yes stop_codon:yes gene_type:complete